MNALETTTFGSIVGLLFVVLGELFGLAPLTLVGVGTFAVSLLAAFPIMTRNLLVGTHREWLHLDTVFERPTRPR